MYIKQGLYIKKARRAEDNRRDKLISHANVKAQFRRFGARRCILLSESDIWEGKISSIVGFARAYELLFRLGGSNALVLGIQNQPAAKQVLVRLLDNEQCEHLRDALIEFQRKIDPKRWRSEIISKCQ